MNADVEQRGDDVPVERTTTQRGFSIVRIPFQDYPGCPERVMEVQESSLASRRMLWVGPNSVYVEVPGARPGATLFERAHLDEGAVRALRDALTEWLGDGQQAVAG